MTVKGRTVILVGAALMVACFTAFGIMLHHMFAKTEVAATAETPAHVEIRTVATPAPSADAAQPLPTPTPDMGFCKGAENEIVQVIQERLMELGYLELDESTQKYGSQTEAAVRLFQRQVNFTDGTAEKLDEDGICGAMTLDYLFADDAPHYVVKFGMEGEDITNMQLQLKDLGYISATTGYFGEKTVVAMKEFQGRNGLDQDGLAGERSFELLYSPNAKESKSKSQTARTRASVSKMIEVTLEPAKTKVKPQEKSSLRVTLKDAISANELFTLLMGDQVEPRREFIEENAKLVMDLDV